MEWLQTPAHFAIPTNPLKTTTAEIFHGWQEELAQLQRRWNEIKANAQAEREEGMEEAEGLRQRMQALRDLIAEAEVVGKAPETWRTEVPAVRLGSMVRLEFEDGGQEDFLFIGLAGPTSPENMLTPKTPLGAAILGRKVGEQVAYHVGAAQFHVVARKCLIPDAPAKGREQRSNGDLQVVTGQDEQDEAGQVSALIENSLKNGMPPAEIVLAWRAPYQGVYFENALAAVGIRYRFEGCESFYTIPIIRDLLALCRLLLDPSDPQYLPPALRIFSHAPFDVLMHLAAAWQGPETTPIPGLLTKDRGVTQVLQVLRMLSPQAGARKPVEILAEIAHQLGRLRPEMFRDGFNSPWLALLKLASNFNSLRDMLVQADEVEARSHKTSREGVVLTPLEQLGDRRFTDLYIVGANEGALPFIAKDQQETLPGERELFYGVLTVAKKATISWSKTLGGKPAKQSRFLTEIDLAGVRGRK